MANCLKKPGLQNEGRSLFDAGLMRSIGASVKGTRQIAAIAGAAKRIVMRLECSFRKN